jgi:hypothetical protein
MPRSDSEEEESAGHHEREWNQSKPTFLATHPIIIRICTALLVAVLLFLCWLYIAVDGYLWLRRRSLFPAILKSGLRNVPETQVDTGDTTLVDTSLVASEPIDVPMHFQDVTGFTRIQVQAGFSGPVETTLQPLITQLGTQVQNLDAALFNVLEVGQLQARRIRGRLQTADQPRVTGIGSLVTALNMGLNNIINADHIEARTLYTTLQHGVQPRITSVGILATPLDLNGQDVRSVETLEVAVAQAVDLNPLGPSVTFVAPQTQPLDMQSHRIQRVRFLHTTSRLMTFDCTWRASSNLCTFSLVASETNLPPDVRWSESSLLETPALVTVRSGLYMLEVQLHYPRTVGVQGGLMLNPDLAQALTVAAQPITFLMLQAWRPVVIPTPNPTLALPVASSPYVGYLPANSRIYLLWEGLGAVSSHVTIRLLVRHMQ